MYFNVLHNFFVPQQKLISKTRIGSRYVKEYDAPLTPYQRVMLSPFVPKSVKTDLRKKYESLNPIELKEKLDKKMKEFRKKLKELKEERGDHLREFEEREAS